MRVCFCAALLAALAVGPRCLAQDTPSRPPSNKPPESPRELPSDLVAIRAGAQAFAAAFTKGDAKSISALWVEEGDYTDDSGTTFRGREAIENEYARFFAAHPGHKIRLVIDSLKLLNDSAAIEDGRALLDPPPVGAPATSKYTAVHVKVDGKWLLSTVRDTRVETPSSYHTIADLEWLIGTWSAEEHGAKTESVCQWVANKCYVERKYSTTHADGSTASGVQLIGWNPLEGRVQSWNFSSDGGYAIGVWTPSEGGWAAEIRGVSGDGTLTTATNLLTKMDQDAYVWQSVNRAMGDQPLPDTDEIVLKRRPK